MNKLPEDVRKLVEPMIANQMKSARVEYVPHTNASKTNGVLFNDELQSMNALKLLNDKIEKLQQSLDKALPK